MLIEKHLIYKVDVSFAHYMLGSFKKVECRVLTHHKNIYSGAPQRSAKKSGGVPLVALLVFLRFQEPLEYSISPGSGLKAG